jgi:nanoRNase/pAp phosphatase (c-di-AMP/oligoRNAs hydrolase)
MGGGGHEFASGFKVTGSRKPEQIREECLQAAEDLLGEAA